MSVFFFFNDTATTEIYTLSLHDALPICNDEERQAALDGGYDLERVLTHDDMVRGDDAFFCATGVTDGDVLQRSEEHTSELQSRQYLVCRLLLEKKNKHAELAVNSQTSSY